MEKNIKIYDVSKQIIHSNPVLIKYSLKQYKGVLEKGEIPWIKGKEAIVTLKNVKYNFGIVDKVYETTKYGMDCKRVILNDKNGRVNSKNSAILMFEGTNSASNSDIDQDKKYVMNSIFNNFVNANKSNLTNFKQNVNGNKNKTNSSNKNNQNIRNIKFNQGEEAYKLIEKEIPNFNKNPKFKLFLNGHSLGGMNVQYAFSKFVYNYPKYANRVFADILESPNIYNSLPKEWTIAADIHRTQVRNISKKTDKIGNAVSLMGYDSEFDYIGQKLELKDDSENFYINLLTSSALSLIKSLFTLSIDANEFVSTITKEHMLDSETRKEKLTFDQEPKFTNFEAKFLSEMSSLISHTGSGDSIYINEEEVKIVCNNLVNIVEKFKEDINSLINNLEHKLKEEQQLTKRMFYEYAPDLDQVIIESEFNNKIIWPTVEVINKYKDILVKVDTWSEEINNYIRALESASTEFSEFDKQQKNKLNYCVNPIGYVRKGK